MHTYELDPTQHHVEIHLSSTRRDTPVRWRMSEVTWHESSTGSLIVRGRTPAESPEDGPELARFAPGEWRAVTLHRTPQTPEESRLTQAELDAILRPKTSGNGASS